MSAKNHTRESVPKEPSAIITNRQMASPIFSSFSVKLTKAPPFSYFQTLLFIIPRLHFNGSSSANPAFSLKADETNPPTLKLWRGKGEGLLRKRNISEAGGLVGHTCFVCYEDSVHAACREGRRNPPACPACAGMAGRRCGDFIASSEERSVSLLTFRLRTTTHHRAKPSILVLLLQ